VLTGNPLGGSGRNAFGGKSPLTGGFGEGDVGGYFGAELKRAGWDAVIVSGVADRPVYIAIDDDKAEIKDADGVWGLTTGKTEDALREELGDKK
ncbi:MAG: aldehyde ferredoxin oxidoreductase N-terminal domain-containing protein, partial [Candidatus Thalassarchaeaceae archaeon]|nr:aldehyde ferredoxin oxidoreductase N-terminal domain-containing protein [Candidatus Thalassarchaeaceae archaeon]